jgi:hypothetical protein
MTCVWKQDYHVTEVLIYNNQKNVCDVETFFYCVKWLTVFRVKNILCGSTEKFMRLK